MDNKITRDRLSHFLSYEWIVMAIITAIAIAVWALIYNFASVRLTTGQSFKYYYDQNLYSGSDYSFNALIEKDVFGYDIREIDSEAVIAGKSVLSLRLSNYEGDAIFTDVLGEKEEGKSYVRCRANEIIDDYTSYALDGEEDGILYDATAYLSQFLKDGESDPLEYSNLSEDLISAHFDERMKTSRVYKNYVRHGQISVEQEYGRIQKLCEEARYFKKLLEYDKTLPESESLFYRYVRDSQSFDEANEKDKSLYNPSENKERPYALKVGMLTGGAKKTSDFFKTASGDTSGVVLILFDFKSEQADLQYEELSFINFIVRNFSDIRLG